MYEKQIGKSLFELRKKYSLTQQELANLIPVSRETISKWERGIYTPSVECLIKLSSVFQISIDEILSLSEDIYEIVD